MARELRRSKGQRRCIRYQVCTMSKLVGYTVFSRIVLTRIKHSLAAYTYEVYRQWLYNSATSWDDAILYCKSSLKFPETVYMIQRDPRLAVSFGRRRLLALRWRHQSIV